MRSAIFSLVAALAAPLVSAIAFTDPAENATVAKGADYELTWTSVDTDPSTFSIYLVNFVNWPPYYTPLALDIETSLGAYSVRVPCAADDSYGFQFNAINGTNVYVIYAQTPKFFIDGDACTDPSTSPSCAPAATVTVTVSTTLSSASFSTTTPFANSTSSHHHHKTTSGGKCPDTIGWGGSGYSHPVTLTSAPTSPGGDSGTATEYYASTSTVYTTVYRDMSEADHCQC